MDHQQLAGSPAFALMHGQLSMVLAGCQQLPVGWQQQEEFKSLLQHALDLLQEGSSATVAAATDTAAHTSDDKSTKQRQPSADQDKRRQQKHQQQHMHPPLDTTAEEDCTAAAAGIAAQVSVIGSASSDTAAQLQALHNLAAAVADEYAEVQEAETPVRSAVCAAGGLNHLLQVITAADTSDANINTTASNTGSSSSCIAVAISAGQLLLALTECRGGSHRYCNNWAHRYVASAALPALVRLLLFQDTIAKRAAELLGSLARDAGRCTEIAAAGGIAGLLHVLSDDALAGKVPASVPLAGNVLARSYAVLAAAAAALEALIVDGPLEVQIAVAEAGGVLVLERICEHLVRQKMSRRQRLGAAKHQHHGMCASCTVRAG